MSLQDVVSVRVVASSPMVSPVGQGAMGTWFPTADGFGIRFPDGDHYVHLEPPRRWKRGQKLNRGGRRRARAKHAANEQEAFNATVWERVAAPGGMNPPDFGSPEAWALLDAVEVDLKSWAPKTGREILEDLRAAAARFDASKDGDQ